MVLVVGWIAASERRTGWIGLSALGIPPDTLQTKETRSKDLPHYASRCIDFSYMMRSRRGDGSFAESPKEICGLALRGDFDLRRHQMVRRLPLLCLVQEHRRAGLAPPLSQETSARRNNASSMPAVNA